MWTISAEMKRRLNVLEMDYLRRSEEISRRERIRNGLIRQRTSKAQDRQTILERIKIKTEI